VASKLDIYNMAISNLGMGKEVASVTDSSSERKACDRFYEEAKKSTLKAISWPFATAYFTLNLIEESPDNEWGFSYRYPVDCLSVRRVLSGNRNDTKGTRVPYKILKDSAGKLIYTDRIDAEVEYTQNLDDPSYFSSEFVLALSFRLAGYIAPRITSGDPFKLKQEMFAQYQAEISLAKKEALNEEVQEASPESESITIRG